MAPKIDTAEALEIIRGELFSSRVSAENDRIDWYQDMIIYMRGHWRNFGHFLVAGNSHFGIKAKTSGKAVINFLDKSFEEQVILVAIAIESGIFETEVD